MSHLKIPARFRAVTQDNLHAYFDGLGITPRCALCNNAEFSLPLMYKHSLGTSAPAAEDVPLVVPHVLPSALGGSQEVVFPLTCEHCGTMLLINAEWIAPDRSHTQWGSDNSLPVQGEGSE
ncbi:hypothetical protein N7346_03500 [Aeromonas caviae]|uniref:Uncharacterized protein n=1 Tax=Aeromonas caviae TaxID=648 RepID=A0AA42V9A7_AERCA|nr:MULTISPECIES: hypothetical protein [Aeromonas]MBP4058650.1 hypothetical protein [Aeromonas sp. Prich7-2]MDH0316216.1 hypothetical protein [Aeromonas caviae]MDH1896701.1 hypothetical protein [Aeromonas caviae]